MQKFIGLFPLWAILLSFVAYYFPAPFVAQKQAIVPLLALVMFGMGMTLTWDHFKQAAAQPKIISLTLLIQYSLMPLCGYILALLLELPEQHLIGLVLVGSSAGGTASNVICFLGRGNVALSILMTLSSTLCAVLLMPLLSWLYLQQMVNVPVWDMIGSIASIIIAPVLCGTTINSLLQHRLLRLQPIFPLLSSCAIIAIIAIIVAANQTNLALMSIPILGAVMLHNLFGLCVGYSVPYLLRYDALTCRTVCIEVGMQNSGLSVALALKYFSPVAALPGALFSIWHNIAGSLLAAYWRRAGSS